MGHGSSLLALFGGNAIALHHSISTASPMAALSNNVHRGIARQAEEQWRPLTTMEATAQTKKEPVVFGSFF
ncbi:MAG: hypothetical protein AB7U29_06920 [Desulfobulbus sp.]